MKQVHRRDAIPMLELADIDKLHAFGGVSCYRGVLVLWDNDEDTRVLDFLDEMPDMMRWELIAIHEHEGVVQMFWHGYIPSEYKTDVESPDGDIWSPEHFLMMPKGTKQKAK